MNTRNRIRTLLTLAAVAMAIMCLATPSAGAAELTHDATVKIYEGANFNLSVYPGKASYSGFGGEVTGVIGDGTVSDYRFFNGTGDEMFSYADGTIVPEIVAPVVSPPPENCNGQNSLCSVWTTNDPGTDFANAANYTSNTLAKAQGFTGTIDISGLRSGTVFFIY